MDALTCLAVRGEVSEAEGLEVWARAFGLGSGLTKQAAMTSSTDRLIDLRATHPSAKASPRVSPSLAACPNPLP